MRTTRQDAGRATRASAAPPSDSQHTPPAAPRRGARPDGTLALLPHPTRLHDIANCEAFVQRTIDASGISYQPDEREELLAEGLAILFDLARRYKPLTPRHPGEKPGRFSGYAAMFLPRRLGDAWHRWHPEHRYITDPATGRRRWHYDPPAMSLDGLYDNRAGDTGETAGDAALAHARILRDFVPTTHASHRPQPVPAQPA